MRGLRAGNKDDFLEVARFGNCPCDQKMADVDGIEAAAETKSRHKTAPPDVRSLGGIITGIGLALKIKPRRVADIAGG
jgi:hypothetical protein